MNFSYFYTTIANLFLRIIYASIFTTTISANSSCKKLVEIDAPITSLTARNVYTSDVTAAAVLTGIYANMGNGGVFSGQDGISIRSGLAADELTLWSGGLNNGSLHQFFHNRLLAQQPLQPGYWQNYYDVLLTVNSALQGLESSTSLTPEVKRQLLGEARFLRAFFHFYLVNLFGDVPIATTSDWRQNAVAKRESRSTVYDQIVEDLLEAQNLLSENYLKSDALTPYSLGSEERVRPTKWAATALLARVYLYIEEWGKAEEQATVVINDNSLYGLSSLDTAFMKNNREAIWQIQYVNSAYGTEGYHLILESAPNGSNPVYIGSFLLNAFEFGDNRRIRWIDSLVDGSTTYHFPVKYKLKNDPNSFEYLMVFRLAEQFLIRSEARIRQGNIVGAQDDLNTIRNRAGLGNMTGDESTLIEAIIHERQVELFVEWGHRWFDLKRTNTIDDVMGIVYPFKNPGMSWNPNWKLYPLNQADINLNPNLSPNNPGY